MLSGATSVTTRSSGATAADAGAASNIDRHEPSNDNATAEIKARLRRGRMGSTGRLPWSMGTGGCRSTLARKPTARELRRAARRPSGDVGVLRREEPEWGCCKAMSFPLVPRRDRHSLHTNIVVGHGHGPSCSGHVSTTAQFGSLDDQGLRNDIGTPQPIDCSMVTRRERGAGAPLPDRKRTVLT